MALKCVMLPPALQIFVSIRMAVGAGGPRGHGSPDFGTSVNPISTRGDRLCPPYYYYSPTPDFQTFLRPCVNSLDWKYWSARVAKGLTIDYIYENRSNINCTDH